MSHLTYAVRVYRKLNDAEKDRTTILNVADTLAAIERCETLEITPVLSGMRLAFTGGLPL
jgi:hypothetical protein